MSKPSAKVWFETSCQHNFFLVWYHDVTVRTRGPRRPATVPCIRATLKQWRSHAGAYGKAGNGNEMVTGNGNWKRKPETESRNGNATSSLL